MKGESADRTLARIDKSQSFNTFWLTLRFWQACQGQVSPRYFLHGYHGDPGVEWTSVPAHAPSFQCDRSGYLEKCRAKQECQAAPSHPVEPPVPSPEPTPKPKPSELLYRENLSPEKKV